MQSCTPIRNSDDILYTTFIYKYNRQGLLTRRTTVFSNAVDGVESGAGVIEEYKYDELNRVIEVKSYYPHDEGDPSNSYCPSDMTMMDTATDTRTMVMEILLATMTNRSYEKADRLIHKYEYRKRASMNTLPEVQQQEKRKSMRTLYFVSFPL